jgi:hypothetical protein
MKYKAVLISLIALIVISVLSVTPVGASGVDDSYTKALLHFEGSDASTTFTDESGATWTAYNSAQIDTDQYKFGSASGLFNGSLDSLTGDSARWNDSSNNRPGSGDFTIDAWIRINNLPANGYFFAVLGKRLNVSYKWQFGIYNNNGTYQLAFTNIYNSTETIAIYKDVTISTGTWYHVAVTRSGNNWRMFLDGNQAGTTASDSDTVTECTSGYMAIGGDAGFGFASGWIDELRYSQGIARWTSDFTPAESEYEPIATETPTFTPTITDTPTITYTPTETYTPTITTVYTPSNTPTPSGVAITWADGTVTVSDALQLAIGNLLATTPPDGHDGNIYAITHISGSDTAWNISVINLIDVDPPYDTWNADDNGAWAGYVICSGSEPTWTCVYPEEEPMGGESGLIFPWQQGYGAKYGIAGIHSGAKVMPGSEAVDFVGWDSGPVMPPNVVAAADGVIDYVCDDGTSMGIKVVGGPVTLSYWHFELGQGFSEGQVIHQGQVLGTLKYGTFSGSNCGATQSQNTSTYHLHFVFYETSSGFFEIGGCVLDISTTNFVCNGNTYKIGSIIPNGGDASNSNNGGGSEDQSGYNTAAGGTVHVWDGIVDYIVKLNTDNLSKILPEQDEKSAYFFTKAQQITESLVDFVMFLVTYIFSFAILVQIVLIVFTSEVIIIAVELLIFAIQLISVLAKLGITLI